MSSFVAFLCRSLFAVRGGLGVAAIATVLAGCSGSHSEPPGGSSGTTGTAELSLTVVTQAMGRGTIRLIMSRCDSSPFSPAGSMIIGSNLQRKIPIG